MTRSDETPPYRVDRQADRYRVVDGAGRTVLECRDATSAHHYADLLNKAYRAGYRSGYKSGKGAGDTPRDQDRCRDS